MSVITEAGESKNSRKEKKKNILMQSEIINKQINMFDPSKVNDLFNSKFKKANQNMNLVFFKGQVDQTTSKQGETKFKNRKNTSPKSIL